MLSMRYYGGGEPSTRLYLDGDVGRWVGYRLDALLRSWCGAKCKAVGGKAGLLVVARDYDGVRGSR